MPCILYVLTNSIYCSHGISNLHQDFKKQVVIKNCPFLFICNFTISFPYIYIHISIVIHRQISELISVARQYLPVAGIETRLTQMPSQSF